MKTQILSTAVLAVALGLRADQHIDRLTVGDQTYTNVTVTSHTATDIYFISAGGMGNAKLKDLSPDLQKHFKYDPAQAQAAEAKAAANKANYHAQLVHQPGAQAPDMSRTPGDAGHPGNALWRTDYDGALSQARSDNKLVLLDFTGSDWCPWCIKFDEEVLATDRFNGYAASKLELVKVDFPRHTPLPEDQQRANDALGQRFNVDGYPTYILLTADGRELGRQSGYQPGGPDAFIAELEGFSKK